MAIAIPRYRLAILGESKTQLESPTLREWLGRAGLHCISDSRYGKDTSKEDVWFGEGDQEPPKNTPLVALGKIATKLLCGYDLPQHKIRGSILPRIGGGWFVAGLAPEDVGLGSGQGHLKPLLGADAKRAMDWAAPVIPEVIQMSSPFQLPPIPQQYIVSIDIEGSNGKPHIVGICWDVKKVYVLPWSLGLKSFLNNLFRCQVMPTFHNAAFDVAELQEAGVNPPNVWFDTINIAALYDPEQPMNLQTQVLTHVPGSLTWKGLVDHEAGPSHDDNAKTRTYRTLWGNVLSRLGRPVPVCGRDWYAFYNGLDTAWGLALAISLQEKLEKQGRWDYYEHVMLPLQHPLITIGNRGMPCDEKKVEEHRAECLAKVKTATETLVTYGQAMLKAKVTELESKVYVLEANKAAAKVRGDSWGMQKDLASFKTKLRTASKPFNPDSAPQRADLLYTWYGLPPVKNYGAKGYTTDDTAIKDLLSRLERGTIKPKRGTNEEVKAVLNAMMDAKKWATLERTFLHPEVK